jgi:hypothetical protein
VPLIRAVRNWIALRAANAANSDLNALNVLWWPAIFVLLPILLFLVLVGLVYELVVRIDRSRRLDAWTCWTLAGIAAACLTAGIGWWLLSLI